jgi:hypothetical protein
MLEKIDNEVKSFFVKVIIPALIAISVKLAVQHKKESVTVFSVLCSFITGLGSVYLFSDLIMEYFSKEWVSVVIGMIAISGEKIGAWMTYKMNVEAILDNLISKWTKK